MISLFRRVYGESPLHLVGQLATLAVAVYATYWVVEVTSTDNLSLLIWFVGGALLHDLLFVPVYLVLDLIARLGIQDHALRHVRAINYIRFPVAISGSMLFLLFPLILSKGKATFERTSGEQAPDYVSRWLLVTALVFAVSAIAYAVALRRDAMRVKRTAGNAPAAEPPPASVRA